MTLAGVVILSGVITLLGADGGLKPYVRLLCSLSVLCVLISPLISAVGGDFSLGEFWSGTAEQGTDYEEAFRDAWQAHEIMAAEDALEEIMASSLSMKREDFEARIETHTENGNAELASVTVILRDRGVLADPKKISSYVNEALSCPCVIVYE